MPNARIRPPDNSPFMVLSQVMEYTTLARSTIYLHVSNGTFPRPHKVGRSIVWSRAAVKEWATKVLAK